MNNNPQPPHVLMISNDIIGEKMAGAAIRYWEFARVLSQHCRVTLAIPPIVPVSSSFQPSDFETEVVICPTVTALRSLADRADVIVTLGDILAKYSFLVKCGKPLVLDLYDPFLLAGLHKFSDHPLSEQLTLNKRYQDIHRFQIGAADFMICASERQRDYWLGMLTVLGRINPFTSDDDPTLRRLIDVVPFGLPSEPPAHTRPVLKGVYKSIEPQDKVILWGGGIWNWFDAPTLIRAMSMISQQRSDIKLFFMGINRPNLALPKMAAVEQAITLSQELDLYDRNVFFNDWTPYGDRQNYLLEADIGASLHLEHAETRFSFRTRLLDYLWAELPILTTEGDVLSEMVQQRELGRVVKPGDVQGIVQAILEMLNTPDLRARYQARFRQVKAQYHWEEVTRPLLDFCLNPHLAPDKTYHHTSWLDRTVMNWGPLVRKAWCTAQRQGPIGMLRKVDEYLRWRFNWK